MLEAFFAAILGFLATFGLASHPSPDVLAPPVYESVSKSSEDTTAPPEDQDGVDAPTTNANGYPIVGG